MNQHKFFSYAIFLLLLCLLSLCPYAQQCGNCNNTPRVVLYDAHVQVPKPTDADSLLKWKLLFQTATSIDVHIYKLNKDCPFLRVPFSKNEQGDETIRVSSTSTNVPSSSVDGDYFVTGYITQSEEQLMFQLQLKAACSGKIVTSASAPMPLTTDLITLSNIVKQAASQLSPLIEKIKKFELDERQKDKKLSLYQTSWGEPIKITPKKSTLKAGESTDFTIELKDCDNVPLQGREILFTETEFEGLRVYGTMGGTVTPAKVVTDANGKATARFTLKAGAKEAIINAHSPGNEVKGCSSMFIGDAAINIRRTYSGNVTFTYSSSGSCNEESTNGCLKSTLKSNHDMGITYKAAFYDDGSKQDKSVHFSSEEEETSLVPRVMETGSYTARKFQMTQGEIVCESVSKGERTVQKIQSVSGGDLKSGNFSFSFGAAGSGSVSVNMVFTANTNSSFEQTHLPSSKGSSKEDIGWEFSAIEGFDKDFTFKKENVGGKIKYTVSGTRTSTANSACGGISTSETIKAVVVEE